MTQLSGDWAAMYVSSINRYDHLCMSILRAAADGGSLTDVLEIVGDSMNACDHPDAGPERPDLRVPQGRDREER